MRTAMIYLLALLGGLQGTSIAQTPAREENKPRWEVSIGMHAAADHLSAIQDGEFTEIDDILNEETDRISPTRVLEDIAGQEYGRFHGGLALTLSLTYTFDKGKVRAQIGVPKTMNAELERDYTNLAWGDVDIGPYHVTTTSLGVRADGTAQAQETPISLEYTTNPFMNIGPAQVSWVAALGIRNFETSVTKQGRIYGVMTVSRDGNTILETSEPTFYWQSTGTQTLLGIGPSAALTLRNSELELALLPAYTATHHDYLIGFAGVDFWKYRKEHAGFDLLARLTITQDLGPLEISAEYSHSSSGQSANMGLSFDLR